LEAMMARMVRIVAGLTTGEKVSPKSTLLALLKYPFYPLFILDNGINLISKSLTVLTPP